MNTDYSQPWYLLLIPAFFIGLALVQIYRPYWAKARNYRIARRSARMVNRAHKQICNGELPGYMKKPSTQRTHLPHLSPYARAALHQEMAKVNHKENNR